MKILDVFILFPENDNEICDIVSSCGIQYFASEIIRIKSSLSSSYTLYYDSNNISVFKDKIKQLDDGSYFDSLSNNLTQLIGKKSFNIRKSALIKSDCHYLNWDINDYSIKEDCPYLVKYASEKASVLAENDTVMISFSDYNKRDFLSIIKDAKHYTELPLLVKIPFFNPISTFIEWYERWKCVKRKFGLTDVKRFSRTNFIYWRNGSKQRIYEEYGTHNYWYYDYFHKNNKEHYEVFDSQGNHIGEADIEGNINPETKDNNKSIKQYLK